VSVTGNVTVGPNNLDFKFRKTQCFFARKLVPFEEAAAFVSVGVEASIQPGQVNASGDILIGAVKFGNGFPVGYLGYLAVAAQANVNWTGFNFTTDVTAQMSAGFILSGMVAVSERTPDGKVATHPTLFFNKTKYLNLLTWRISDVSFNSNGTGGQSSITWTGTPEGLQALLPGTVSVTFVISDVLAEVSAGKVKAAVSPKHIESFVEINGWELSNSSNYLGLTYGVLTGSAVGASAAHVSISTGTGSNQVYAHFAAVADVSGKVGVASVTKTVGAVADAAILFGDASLTASVVAVYQANVAFYVVDIKFPPGETHIIYDPSMGAGPPVQSAEVTTTQTGATTQTGSSESLIFSIIVMLFAILF
jgi:hypothetical protein